MTVQNDANSAVGHQQRPRKPLSETENKIFVLLRSIPVLKPGISDDHCRAYAQGLNGIVVMAQMNLQGPGAQRVGAKRTQKELKRLADSAEKIAKTLGSAHRETNEVIQAALPEGLSLSQYKKVMQQIFRVLYQADVDAGELTAKGQKPSDEFAAEVEGAAAEAFTALTGRKAVPIVKQVLTGSSGTKAQSGGPYLEFLATLFKALGIDASAEYHARLRINRA